MNPYKYLILSGSLVMLLSACGNLDQLDQETASNQLANRKTISTGRIDDSHYQSIIEDGKYQSSAGRDYTASRLNSHYNLKNYERGLTYLSKQQFSVDEYYFQEGQFLTIETLESWLSRKSEQNPQGLNSEDPSDPIIVQQILEQDFIDMKTQKIAGMNLGIALNQVYELEDGTKIELTDAELRTQGEAVADTILKRLRETKGLAAIPIMISLYKQAPKDNLAGGEYIAVGLSEHGSDEIKKWTDVDEHYVLLPVKDGEESIANEDGLSNKFTAFKEEVQSAFPNLTSVTGIAYYKDKSLQNVSITIHSKYTGMSEIMSYTQYLGKLLETNFNVNAEVEVKVESLDEIQAFLEKKPDQKNVYSHIFQ